ncbi:MAG: hypothetical protein AAF620_15305 [Bacteroidota bacterium]
MLEFEKSKVDYLIQQTKEIREENERLEKEVDKWHKKHLGNLLEISQLQEEKEKLEEDLLTEYSFYLVKTRSADDLYCSIQGVVNKYLKTKI